MLEFLVLAQECAPTVAPQTMAAIVQTESRFNPLAIGVNGGTRLQRQPATKEEAVATAKALIKQGYNIDLGLGQVNSANLPKTGLSVEDAFDPCRNLAVAASILQGNYERARPKHDTEQAALQAAFSAYNTGSMSRGFKNGYVQKVVANADALQSVAVPAVQAIPLVGAKGAATAPARRKAQPATRAAPITKADRLGAVKLQPEGAKPKQADPAFVFESDTPQENDTEQSILVF